MTVMPRKKTHARPSSPIDDSISCRIEAVLSVDGRGQLVIPKEIRAKAYIADGDKLALVSWEKDDNICCLTLVKTDELSSDVEDILRPVMTGSQ